MVEAVAVPVEGVPVEAVAVPAPQGQQTLLSATVPAGVGPGMPFIISAPNGASVMVTCPPGAVAGQQVQIPFNAQPERRITGTVDPQDEQHGQCCEPGGPCGPPIPPRQQLEADGTISVLRITYYCEGCCGPSQAFKKRDMPPNIPGPLREIGVTESEWSRFVSRLEAEVQPMRDGKCNVKCWCCLFIGLFTLCLACPIMCKMDKEHIMAWDSLLRKWQADFNAQVGVRPARPNPSQHARTRGSRAHRGPGRRRCSSRRAPSARRSPCAGSRAGQRARSSATSTAGSRSRSRRRRSRSSSRSRT